MNFLGLDEILIIVLVSLIILGPVKTFGIAVYFGRLFGKAKGYVKKISCELELDEAKKTALNIKTGFKDALKDPLVSKLPEPSTKRMWTVDESGTDSIEPRIQAKKCLSDTSAAEDLLKRVKALEDEIEKLKNTRYNG